MLNSVFIKYDMIAARECITKFAVTASVKSLLANEKIYFK